MPDARLEDRAICPDGGPVPALTYQEPIIDLASVQGWRTLDGFKEAGRLVISH